ncbi:MAG TPA: LamG domain-containing protein [Pseudomonadales bacterium]|nr:LamG domain-containing protein [Pseudomonadales bacterium]
MSQFSYTTGLKSPGRQIYLSHLLVVLFFVISAVNLAAATDTNPPPRLTIELRDGSRIVGTSAEKFFEFHSALLGDLKLEVKNIRSVECISSNITKVTTINGDSFSVSFIDAKLPVKTSFGKVELATGSIHRLMVLAQGGSVPSPPGLVGFWSGEGEGKDSVAGNDATLTDVTFVDGINGPAFSFNGTSSMMKIPASQATDLGADGGFTIMAWIKPSDVEGLHPIFQWLQNDTWDDDALSLWMGVRPEQNGVLRAFFVDGEANAFVASQQGVLVPGIFQHIAFTFDKATGVATLYVNGVIVAQRSMIAGASAHTKGDLWVSWRDVRPGNWSTGRMYSGLIDDIALYNRALSAAEIQSVCTEECNGEPLNLPAPSTGWWDLMR